MDKDFLGIHKPLDFKGSAGVGYVVIPRGVERDQYVENCYRTHTVTIQGGYGYGEFGEVYVSQSAIQEIEFPSGIEGADRYGSAVVWIRDDATRAPVIVATVRRQDHYYELGEGVRRLAVGLENGSSVELRMSRDGVLQISVVGGSESPASATIKVTSPNGDSRLTVDCDNEVVVNVGKKLQVTTPGTIEARFVDDQMDEKTVIRFQPSKGLEYKDEFGNTITAEDGRVHVVSKEISHNDGNEPMVLGDSLAKFIGDFLDAVTRLTVMTPVGASTVPVNVSEFVALKSRFEEFKSKKSNLE